jgi:hypothetical protein
MLHRPSLLLSTILLSALPSAVLYYTGTGIFSACISQRDACFGQCTRSHSQRTDSQELHKSRKLGEIESDMILRNCRDLCVPHSLICQSGTFGNRVGSITLIVFTATMIFTAYMELGQESSYESDRFERFPCPACMSHLRTEICRSDSLWCDNCSNSM